MAGFLTSRAPRQVSARLARVVPGPLSPKSPRLEVGGNLREFGERGFEILDDFRRQHVGIWQ